MVPVLYTIYLKNKNRMEIVEKNYGTPTVITIIIIIIIIVQGKVSTSLNLLQISI